MTILLIAYVIFLIVFAVYSWAALYHLEEFGFVGDASRIVMGVYILLASSTIVFSFIFLFRG